MPPLKDRYFVAVVPPAPYYGQAQELKEYFKDHFKSKASLNSPPHITLHMPFEWRRDREEELVNSLQLFAASLSPAQINFNDFNCFAPRVIFIAVSESSELNDLQLRVRQFCKRELGLFNADYKDLPFHPHLTIAFRDLKKKDFKTAWEEFCVRKFEGQFLINKMSLLKHNGERWNVIQELNFKG